MGEYDGTTARRTTVLKRPRFAAYELKADAWRDVRRDDAQVAFQHIRCPHESLASLPPAPMRTNGQIESSVPSAVHCYRLAPRHPA